MSRPFWGNSSAKNLGGGSWTLRQRDEVDNTMPYTAKDGGPGGRTLQTEARRGVLSWITPTHVQISTHHPRCKLAHYTAATPLVLT